MISDVTSQGRGSWTLQKAMIQLLGASRLSTTSCFVFFSNSGGLDGTKSLVLSDSYFDKFIYTVWFRCAIFFRRISGLNIMISQLRSLGEAIGHVDFPRIGVNGVPCHHMSSHVEWWVGSLESSSPSSEPGVDPSRNPDILEPKVPKFGSGRWGTRIFAGKLAWLAGKIHSCWRWCISYWKWGIFQCHVSFQEGQAV